MRSPLNSRSHKHVCKCSAELTRGKNSCELFPPTMRWTLAISLRQRYLTSLFVTKHLVCFPKVQAYCKSHILTLLRCRVTSKYFRFQLRNKPTACYVLQYLMWHVTLLDAHCPTCASYSFPKRAGKGGESATHTRAVAPAFCNGQKEQRKNMKRPSTSFITMSASSSCVMRDGPYCLRKFTFSSLGQLSTKLAQTFLLPCWEVKSIKQESLWL